MSATRDKSQKIGFVYSNLYHMYKSGKVESIEPVVIGNIKKESTPIERLKDNLKTLSSLHARLKAMIEELETLTLGK